jgi:hypothetical protein
MRDFTLDMFRKLVETLVGAGYRFITFEEYLNRYPVPGKGVIMRHDIDRRPGNALLTARLENKIGVKASYYFRMVKESFDASIIKHIAEMGHEIGYHYEDLTLTKGDIKKAIANFQDNLNRLREIVPVKTICMHGSPLSRWDNREMWRKYNYKDFDIMGEPYIDIDFSQVFYLTDTGRCWNGEKKSIRDRVNPGFNIEFKSTNDIIENLITGSFPGSVMFNIHSQRWDNRFFPWASELIRQNIKNIIKASIVRRKANR